MILSPESPTDEEMEDERYANLNIDFWKFIKKRPIYMD